MRKEYQGDLSKTHARMLAAAALAALLGAACTTAARAETSPVRVPDKSFPESVTSTKNGTLYVGSFNNGGVTLVTPDGKAEQLVSPGAN
ncbi:MAG: hypothetical protein JOY90_17480, partial [Bradyrhizobium sp.]|nr:hypothetical protein [Bradyrhizobium sp.]